jgi:putative serine protease PepD
MSGSRNPRSRFLAPGAAAVLCAAALLASGCSPSSGSDAGSPGGAGAAAADATTSAGGSAGALQGAYQNTVKNVLPSVVQITTSQDLGSGVVYDDKGDIVTNAHVVGNGKTFQVSLATGGKPLSAKLVSAFPANDLAVIRLTSVPKGLKPAVFADSGSAVGELVLAMGNPLGLSSSVTEGIVSATDRTVSEGESDSGSGGGSGATIPDMVQTSAAINPGNSGGALVDLGNEVIGIPTLAATDPQLGSGSAPGIGFAIPSSTVKRIADQIIKNGKVTDSGRAALGVTVRGVVSQSFQPAGAAIVTVDKGGAAAKAGLKAGDVITRVGGTKITTVQSLTEALAADKPGQKVQLTYLRNTSPSTTRVTLGSL